LCVVHTASYSFSLEYLGRAIQAEACAMHDLSQKRRVRGKRRNTTWTGSADREKRVFSFCHAYAASCLTLTLQYIDIRRVSPQRGE
jgi:hypothetical protein